jgi:uncharacterized protein YceK
MMAAGESSWGAGRCSVGADWSKEVKRVHAIRNMDSPEFRAARVDGNNRELQIMRKLVLSGLTALLVALLSGCATYYKVSDPNSSNVYYTTDIDKEKSGAISFTDAKSKAKVTLQSSAITEISSDEWDKAVGD